MMHEVTWHGTKEVKLGYCVGCVLRGVNHDKKMAFKVEKLYIERYYQGQNCPIFSCRGCGRFVFYLHDDSRPGWWIEKDITDNFKGVVL